MTWWKEYILSLMGCVLFCGIISHLISDLRYKRLIRLLTGTLLALTVFGPLTGAGIPDSLNIDVEVLSPEPYVEIGKQTARQAQEQCIREACESYISSKANEFGMTVTPEVYLNERMEPNFVRIYGQTNSVEQHRLEVMLEENLGITKENQVWIWNQGKDSS